MKETCQAIWIHLKDMDIPQPTEEMWLDITNHFYVKTNFPNCVDSEDDKNI